MSQSKPSTLLPPELDEFLLAEVGVQSNGLSITVLSLLARIGKDPWAEAERLAALPDKTAIAAMTADIEASHICAAPECDPSAVATGLVRRLPSHDHSSGVNAAGIDTLAIIHSRLALLVLWISFGVLLIEITRH